MTKEQYKKQITVEINRAKMWPKGSKERKNCLSWARINKWLMMGNKKKARKELSISVQ